MLGQRTKQSIFINEAVIKF